MAMPKSIIYPLTLLIFQCHRDSSQYCGPSQGGRYRRSSAQQASRVWLCPLDPSHPDKMRLLVVVITQFKSYLHASPKESNRSPFFSRSSVMKKSVLQVGIDEAVDFFTWSEMFPPSQKKKMVSIKTHKFVLKKKLRFQFPLYPCCCNCLYRRTWDQKVSKWTKINE